MLQPEVSPQLKLSSRRGFAHVFLQHDRMDCRDLAVAGSSCEPAVLGGALDARSCERRDIAPVGGGDCSNASCEGVRERMLERERRVRLPLPVRADAMGVLAAVFMAEAERCTSLTATPPRVELRVRAASHTTEAWCGATAIEKFG